MYSNFQALREVQVIIANFGAASSDLYTNDPIIAWMDSDVAFIELDDIQYAET